jgi:hypothetical protein
MLRPPFGPASRRCGRGKQKPPFQIGDLTKIHLGTAQVKPILPPRARGTLFASTPRLFRFDADSFEPNHHMALQRGICV